MGGSVVLVDLAGRPVSGRRMPRPRVPDDAIEAAIRGVYRERAAAGLTRPTVDHLERACGTRSHRVAALHNALRRAGELPELEIRSGQQRSTTRGKTHFLPAGRPGLRKAGRAAPSWEDRDWPYPLYGLVREAMRRERRRGRWAAGLRAASCI